MKKIAIILISFFISLSLFAQNNDQLLTVAADFYKKQDYEKAIEAYQKIIAQGFESPELYYNLGNSYFKSNKFTFAILNYERAKLLDPANEEISFNLKIAQQHNIDAIDAIPEWFLKSWINQLISSRSADFWSVLSIFTFILLLSSGLFFLFTKSLLVKKISFAVAAFMVIISITSFIFAYKQNKLLTNRDSAIIMSASITVKSSPDQTGTDLFLIHEGLKVDIVDSSGDWREIRLKDGRKGWLLASAIAII